jgi:hypothetical protein
MTLTQVSTRQRLAIWHGRVDAYIKPFTGTYY